MSNTRPPEDQKPPPPFERPGRTRDQARSEEKSARKEEESRTVIRPGGRRIDGHAIGRPIKSRKPGGAKH